MRVLKRHLSDAIYRTMLRDARDTRLDLAVSKSRSYDEL